MAIFTPSGDADLSVPQPQGMSATGRLLSGLSDVAGGVTQSLFGGRGGGGGGESPTVDYTAALDKINQLHEQGRETEARAVERNLSLSLAQIGALDANFQRVYEATTGRPFEAIGQSARDQVRNAQLARLNSEAGQNALLVAQMQLGGNASAEDIQNHALTRMARIETLNQLNAENKAMGEYNWNASRQIFVERRNALTSSIFAPILAESQTGQVSPRTIEEARAALQMASAALLSDRPANTPDAEWNAAVVQPLQAMGEFLTMLTEQDANVATMMGDSARLRFMETIVASGGGDVLADAAILAQASTTEGMVQLLSMFPGGGITERLGVLSNVVRNSGDSIGGGFGVQVGSGLTNALTAMFGAGLNEATATPAEMNLAGVVVPPEQVVAWKGAIAQSGLEPAVDVLEGLGAFGGNMSFNGSPDQSEAFFNNVGMLAAGFKSVSEENAMIRYGKMVKIFNPALIVNIGRFAATDPQRGLVLAAFVRDSIDTARAIMETQVSTVEAKGIVRWENGRYVLDEEKVGEDIRAGKIDAEDWVAFQQMLDMRFGGDINRLVEQGPRQFINPDVGVPNSPMSRFSRVLRTYRFDSLNEVKDARKSIDHLNAMTRRLDGFKPRGEGGVTTQPIPVEGGLLGMIDRTEGMGDYDKLFASAERNRFPVRITDMSIGDLIEFTKPSGEYGQFVKENNPEGVVATPLGRYQIVGSTLRRVTEAMGLDLDTKFTPEVQDSMFRFLVDEVRSRVGDSPVRLARELKKVWVGLKSFSDDQVASMVMDFLEGRG